MRRFYEELPKQGPAVALRGAQTFLRNLTAEQREGERNRLVQALDEAGRLQRIGQWNDTRDIPTADVAPEDSGFSHPYFWAPFIYVGAA